MIENEQIIIWADQTQGRIVRCIGCRGRRSRRRFKCVCVCLVMF